MCSDHRREHGPCWQFFHFVPYCFIRSERKRTGITCKFSMKYFIWLINWAVKVVVIIMTKQRCANNIIILAKRLHTVVIHWLTVPCSVTFYPTTQWHKPSRTKWRIIIPIWILLCAVLTNEQTVRRTGLAHWPTPYCQYGVLTNISGSGSNWPYGVGPLSTAR